MWLKLSVKHRPCIGLCIGTHENEHLEITLQEMIDATGFPRNEARIDFCRPEALSVTCSMFQDACARRISKQRTRGERADNRRGQIGLFF